MQVLWVGQLQVLAAHLTEELHDWLRSLRREIPVRVPGEAGMREGWACCPQECISPPALLPLAALSPSMSQSGSELECSGTLGSAGYSVGWLAHKVFCPQKWSMDGKFENHWSGSLRVSLDAFPILGLSLQTLTALPGGLSGSGGGAAPGLGSGPGSSALPQCFRRPCLLRGLGPICSGWGWGRMRPDSGSVLPVSPSVSGSPFFHLLLSQWCLREEMWHHHPVC